MSQYPRTNNYETPYVQSSTTPSISSQSSVSMRLQSQQALFYNRPPYISGNSRRNYPNNSHLLDPPPPPLRGSTIHNGDEQHNYNSNFSQNTSDRHNMIYPETASPSQERRHQHTNNNINNSQGQRTTRWSRNEISSRRNESLRTILPNANFRRPSLISRPSVYPNNHSTFGMQDPIRVQTNDEEQATNTEIPEGSDTEASVTVNAIPPNRIIQRLSSPRRTETHHRPSFHSRTISTIASTVSTPVTTHAARSNFTDNHSSDEQLARRMQAHEFSAITNTNNVSYYSNIEQSCLMMLTINYCYFKNNEHNPLTRLLTGVRGMTKYINIYFRLLVHTDIIFPPPFFLFWKN